ncbi:cAMP-independent regulatory protein pac2 like [Verticillium longisporum]|nr:cAMP-independent regulatory protein pac2 like [Verticillium longisporum]KAG7143021.1 cAMP-independent regulatory protein pac2 like [Verticillium longisporum]
MAGLETYHGYVRTLADAIMLFEACRLGLLPRVQRRPSKKEARSIRPGSVFVWDEKEAGMRRWTDGRSWSASRVSGSFLTYRERSRRIRLRRPLSLNIPAAVALHLPSQLLPTTIITPQRLIQSTD